MTSIIIIQSLSCVVLFITVLILFRKNKNLLETVINYKRKELSIVDERPSYNLYIDKELILKGCISWDVNDSGTTRKLSVRTKDSSLLLYTNGDEFYFKKTEKDAHKVDQNVKETT